MASTVKKAKKTRKVKAKAKKAKAPQVEYTHQTIKIEVARPDRAKINNSFVTLEKEEAWKTILPILWDLQKSTAQVLNYSLREYYFDAIRREEWRKENGKYPTAKQMKALYLYEDLRKEFPTMAPTMLNQLSQKARARWSTDRMAVLFFQSITLPSFRDSHPIIFYGKSTKLTRENGVYYFDAQLRPTKYDGEIGPGITHCRFILNTKKLPARQRNAPDGLISGRYKYGSPHLSYDPRKKKWFVTLQFSIPKNPPEKRKEVRMGVDMGMYLPAVCAVLDPDNVEESESFHHTEYRGAIVSYFDMINRHRRDISRGNKEILNNRAGHGRKKKLLPTRRFFKKSANFKKDINHKISAAIVRYAIEKNVTHILLEDLKGIAKKKTFLRNWTYGDLQFDITYKAEREGIIVEKVKPFYTTQRCSKCGHIHKLNVRGKERFVCTKCEYEAHQSFNAACNIATPGIEDIIAKATGMDEEDKKRKPKKAKKAKKTRAAKKK